MPRHHDSPPSAAYPSIEPSTRSPDLARAADAFRKPVTSGLRHHWKTKEEIVRWPSSYWYTRLGSAAGAGEGSVRCSRPAGIPSIRQRLLASENVRTSHILEWISRPILMMSSTC